MCEDISKWLGKSKEDLMTCEDLEKILELTEKIGFQRNQIPKLNRHREAVKNQIEMFEFLIEEGLNGENTEKAISELKEHSEFVEMVYSKSYGSHIDLHNVNDHYRLRVLWAKSGSGGYSIEPYFEVLKLVKMINGIFEITNPYKSANKIAYGWNKALDKNSDAYMFVVIKNYLIKNNVDFEISDVQKIIGFKDCDSNGW